jgi:hypothetical protein
MRAVMALKHLQAQLGRTMCYSEVPSNPLQGASRSRQQLLTRFDRHILT